MNSKIVIPVVATTAILALDAGASDFKSGYAPVNGLEMYYEVHGAGRPLVLLHGGGSTIETSFGKLLRPLARTRQVIAFEQQGHGHTADVEGRPFTFEQSADDAAALLGYLKIERADFFGYSNGGSIALQIAIRHPRLVRKLVVASAMFKRDGLTPQFWESMKHATLQDMPAEPRQAYLAAAPHPEQLATFHDKSVKRMLQFKDWRLEDIRSIDAPTMVLIGGRRRRPPGARGRDVPALASRPARGAARRGSRDGRAAGRVAAVDHPGLSRCAEAMNCRTIHVPTRSELSGHALVRQTSLQVHTSREAALVSTARPFPARTSVSSLLPAIAAAAVVASTPGPGAVPVSFSELFERSGALTPSARVVSLHGKRVRLVGFMARMELPPRGGFYLCSRPVSADESGAGTADLPVDSVFVVMRSARGSEVPYRPGPLEVTGLLQVGNRADEDGRVAGFQILLEGPAARKRAPSSQSSASKGEGK